MLLELHILGVCIYLCIFVYVSSLQPKLITTPQTQH
jgi:hypothetical protein